MEIMLRVTVTEKTDPLALNQLLEWARRIDGVAGATSARLREDVSIAADGTDGDEPWNNGGDEIGADTQGSDASTTNASDSGRSRRRRRTNAEIAADKAAAEKAAEERTRAALATGPAAPIAPTTPAAPASPIAPTIAPAVTPTVLPPGYVPPAQPAAPPSPPVMPPSYAPAALPAVPPPAADSGIRLEDVRRIVGECVKIKAGAGFTFLRTLHAETGVMVYVLDQVNPAHYPRLITLAQEFLGAQQR